MSGFKLLQLNATANWGSTGKIAEGIGLAAMRRGWESAIAYGRYSNPSQSELIKVGDKWEVYGHYAKAKLLDGEGLGSRNPTRRLIKQIKDYSPDIIHLHNIHDHWLNYLLLFEYLKSVDTPIVWTFHDCWAFTGGCGYFDSVGCEKWKTECVNCPSHRTFIDNSKRNFILKQNLFLQFKDRLTIVPVSDWLADLVKESFLKECDIEVIKNGIDINVFHKSAEKRKVVLGVALPWSARKGLDDAIALRNLLPQDYEIKLIGLTPKQISSLPSGVVGIERTQNVHQLAEEYSKASVFINPSYEDNFPTVNLEALACGTPVVTYRTGGSPEAVDEKTGIVVDKGDVNALAYAVKHVIHDRPFRAEDCRERAVINFNKDTQFGKYIDLYENILTNGQKP